MRPDATHPGPAEGGLNFGALDAALTTQKCGFWHFRFALHSKMLVAAMTDAVASDGRIKRLYLLKTIIAFGGTEVSQRALTDALWPDEEGDAGVNSLGAAVRA